MDLQIKLLSWPEGGHHIIVIGRGLLNRRGLELVFTRLAATTRNLRDFKIVIDLQDAIYNLSAAEIYQFANGIALDGWPAASKIAFVSVDGATQYDQIFMLSAFLANRGLPVSVFNNAKAAVAWLGAA